MRKRINCNRHEAVKSLTGVTGAQRQRRLESPGAEVRSGSLKHQRHRQGNKHDPLSSGFFFYGLVDLALVFSLFFPSSLVAFCHVDYFGCGFLFWLDNL